MNVWLTTSRKASDSPHPYRKKNCLRLMRADIKGVEVVCDVVRQENGSSDRLGENSWLMCSHNRKYFNERERERREVFFFLIFIFKSTNNYIKSSIKNYMYCTHTEILQSCYLCVCVCFFLTPYTVMLVYLQVRLKCTVRQTLIMKTYMKQSLTSHEVFTLEIN